MWVGVSLLRENAILMKLVDNIVVVIVNYVFSKWIIFRKQGTKKD